MDMLETIAARRSIRRFRAAAIPEETITALLEAARLAPSATNAQPWAFLVLREAGARERAMAACYDQPMIGAAPVVILALGDRKAYKKRLRRGKELVEIGAVDAAVMEKVGTAYRERGEESTDEAIRRNVFLAVEHLVLAATGLGLGSCWVGLFQEEALRAAFAIPEHLFPVAVIPVGLPDQDPAPRPRTPLAEIAFADTFTRPWGVIGL